MNAADFWHVALVHALPAMLVCFVGTPFIEYRPTLNWWQRLILTACLLSIGWFIYGAWIE